MIEPSRDPETEAQLVAMAHGEVSATEEAELMSLLESDPVLKDFFSNLTTTHNLLIEVANYQPWQLPSENRERLLATLASPAVEHQPKAPGRRNYSQILIAASIAVFIGIAGLLIFGGSTDIAAPDVVDIANTPAPTTVPTVEINHPAPEKKIPVDPIATIAPRQIKPETFNSNHSVKLPVAEPKTWAKSNSSALRGSDPPIESAQPPSSDTPEVVQQSITEENAKLKHLHALTQTSAVKLNQAYKRYQTLPKIVAIQNQMSEVQDQIQWTEQKIAHLETLMNPATPADKLVQGWKNRNDITIEQTPARNSESLPLIPPTPQPELVDSIKSQNQILNQLQEEQNRIESAIHQIFPEGQYQSVEELEPLLAVMINNYQANQAKYLNMEITVARKLIDQALDIETPTYIQDAASEQKPAKTPQPFQTTVDKVYHRWGFVVIRGGQDQGIKLGDRFVVKRDGLVVGNLKATQINSALSVAEMITDSLAPQMEVAVGDKAIRVLME